MCPVLRSSKDCYAIICTDTTKTQRGGLLEAPQLLRARVGTQIQVSLFSSSTSIHSFSSYLLSLLCVRCYTAVTVVPALARDQEVRPAG